jgi:hypothetical protein
MMCLFWKDILAEREDRNETRLKVLSIYIDLVFTLHYHE